MLILTRNKKEAICINDNILIRILDVKGNQVRLGIDAPRNIPVHRKEIYDIIQGKLEE